MSCHRQKGNMNIIFEKNLIGGRNGGRVDKNINFIGFIYMINKVFMKISIFTNIFFVVLKEYSLAVLS